MLVCDKTPRQRRLGLGYLGYYKVSRHRNDLVGRTSLSMLHGQHRDESL